MFSNAFSPISRSKLHSGILFLLCSFFGSGLIGGYAQSVKLYVSSQAGDRLTAKPVIEFTPVKKEEKATFRINDSRAFQTMAGFGASFLEAGLICLNSLEPTAQEEVLEKLFDSERGAGFTAMKTPIGGTDFMAAGPWYTYNDTPGDLLMKNFSIQRDLGPDGLITYIKRAQKYGKFLLQAPMDYPPDWMLIDVKKNQDVDPRYFDALALYYLRYLQEYQKNKIFVDYLSLFNEPGIYTKIPWTKIRDLLKNHVGPLLQKEGVSTKIMLSEAEERGVAGKNYPTVMDDPAASQWVSVMPYHGYDLKNFDKIAKLHERCPDRPLWMTELCHAYQAGTPKSMKLPRVDFADGDFWGNQIFSDLEAHASAWIYWNMILDQKGGPCLTSPIHGNPPNNIQHPVVIIDRQKKEVIYTGLYYYLAHFSKFVRPGAVRLQTVGSESGVRCIAFKSRAGEYITELMNSRKQEASVKLEWQGRTLSLTLPSVSITTCIWRQ
jgi:glucosylceramidase